MQKVREVERDKRVPTEIPELSVRTKVALRGIPPKARSNIYVQPKGVVATLNQVCPKYTWKADTMFYPTDWMYNKKRKSIFKRKWFHVPTILNPPYAEENLAKESPRGCEEKPLKFHIAHILRVARDSQMPTAVLLPVRENRKWYKKLAHQNDVVRIFFKNPLAFLNIEGKPMPLAKFKSFLILIGMKSKDVFVNNNAEGYVC